MYPTSRPPHARILSTDKKALKAGGLCLDPATITAGEDLDFGLFFPAHGQSGNHDANEQTVAVYSVTLDQTSAALNVGDELALTPTVAPSDATVKTVTWTTSDAAVATVDADGTVTAVGAGTATITATAIDGSGETATCTVTVSPAGYTVSLKEGTEDAANWTITPNPATEGQTVTVTYSGTKKVKSIKAVKKASGPVAYKECPDDSHPHWIDLGLTSGTHWQCCNEGATAPEEYGSYYSYDDAQSYNPPTKGQIQELLDGTTSEWTTQNGVNGRMFTGANGGKVFLPAAGDRQEGELNNVGSDGYYWSSTLTENPSRAYDLYFFSDAAYWSYDLRGYGQSVRPVRKN